MPKRKPLPLAAGILFNLIGIAFFVTAVNGVFLGLVSQSWPTTTATILTNTISEAAAARSSSNFKINLTYAYSIEDKAYSDNTISYPTRTSSSRGDLEKIAQTYPIGSQHPVSYLAKNPSVACLEPGADYGFFILFTIFAAFWCGCGLYLVRRSKPSLKTWSKPS